MREAARYIKPQLERVKEGVGPNIRIEIEENVVGGSFNVIFLGHNMSLGYRNHTNILMSFLLKEKSKTKTEKEEKKDKEGVSKLEKF